MPYKECNSELHGVLSDGQIHSSGVGLSEIVLVICSLILDVLLTVVTLTFVGLYNKETVFEKKAIVLCLLVKGQ